MGFQKIEAIIKQPDYTATQHRQPRRPASPASPFLHASPDAAVHNGLVLFIKDKTLRGPPPSRLSRLWPSQICTHWRKHREPDNRPLGAKEEPDGAVPIFPAGLEKGLDY
jgi:hypothetical protein